MKLTKLMFVRSRYALKMSNLNLN